MENPGVLLFLVMFVMSVFTFLLYGIDKWKAKREKWRIKEKTLLISSVFFGSVGALLGMKVFRHKTKHTYFWVINYTCLVIQIGLVLYLFLK